MRLLKPHEAEGRIPEPSRAEKNRIRLELCEDQKWRCYLCGQAFNYWRQPVIEHVTPGKMGRGTKDWNRKNLKAACVICNGEKGSKRPE